MSRDGYIPETIKEVRMVTNGQSELVAYEEFSDKYLIMFALAIGLVFVAGLCFAKWDNLRRKITKENISVGE